jgi:phenylacetate-CoA ligase
MSTNTNVGEILKNTFLKTNYFSEPLEWDKRIGKKLAWYYAERWSQITEYLAPEVLKDTRRLRLQKLVRYAGNHVPTYVQHYRTAGTEPEAIHSEEDLFMLPPVSKTDFKKYTLQGLSCLMSNLPPYRAYRNTTSGSTGEPFLYHLDNLYEIEKTVLRYRYWERAGVDINEPKIFCAPESALFLVPNLIFLHPHFLQARKKEYIEIIRNSGAKVLFGFPLLVFDLLRMLDEENSDLTFKRVVLAGHAVSPGIRSFFKKRFQCDTFEYYGTGETGSIAAECEAHQGLHIQEENMIVEIVDDFNQPLPPGAAGRILITTLSNEVMPFIRYDTGDKGLILSAGCPCGRRSRRILVDGRDNEYLLLGPDGESISPSILRGILDPYFEYFHRYQVVQKDFQEIEIRIVPTPHFQKVVEGEIIEKIQRAMSSPMNIVVECVDSISSLEGGKFQYFVSDLWSKKFPEGIFTTASLEERYKSASS